MTAEAHTVCSTRDRIELSPKLPSQTNCSCLVVVVVVDTDADCWPVGSTTFTAQALQQQQLIYRCIIPTPTYRFLSLSLSFSNVVSCGCRCPGWCLVTTTRHTVTQRSTLFAGDNADRVRQTDIVTRAVANLTSGHLLINEWHKQIADMFVCFSISLSFSLP